MRTARTVKIPTAALALALAAVLAGCGVSTDSKPHAISRSNVPEGVLDDAGATTSSTRGEGGARASVWFLNDQDGDVRLVRRARSVPRPKTAAAVLDALLLDGPTETERAANITTAISSSTTLASPPELVDRGVLVVDLSPSFFEVVGDDARNAYAQVVCTATGTTNVSGIEGVEAVTFERDGEPTSVFDGNGQETDRPLTCDDYAGLLPRDAG